MILKSFLTQDKKCRLHEIPAVCFDDPILHNFELIDATKEECLTVGMDSILMANQSRKVVVMLKGDGSKIQIIITPGFETTLDLPAKLDPSRHILKVSAQAINSFDLESEKGHIFISFLRKNIGIQGMDAKDTSLFILRASYDIEKAQIELKTINYPLKCTNIAKTK